MLYSVHRVGNCRRYIEIQGTKVYHSVGNYRRGVIPHPTHAFAPSWPDGDDYDRELFLM